MSLVRILAAACGFAVLTAVGCDSGPPMAEVSGAISYDGKLLEKGAITLIPLDGKAKPEGDIIVNGAYKVKVAYGEMKVVITSPKIIGKRKLYGNNPNSPTMDLHGELLPERYNEKSELKLDVKERTIKKDFDLKK